MYNCAPYVSQKLLGQVVSKSEKMEKGIFNIK